MSRPVWATAVVATQITDALSTLSAVGREGIYEANPVMAQLLEAGPGAFVGAKVAAGVALAAWSWNRPASAKVFVGVFAGVTVWNLGVVKLFG